MSAPMVEMNMNLELINKRDVDDVFAVDLSGTWSLESSTGEHQLSMSLPGDVHSALLLANMIEDPYVDDHENKVQWVAKKDWIARRTFSVSTEDLTKSWILDLEGLDTVAEISLNKASVLKAENYFRRYQIDVSSHLKPGENEIEIYFHSNVQAAIEKAEAQPFPIPEIDFGGPYKHINLLRKPHCHFGWDWNAAIMPLGLYGSIGIYPVSQAYITNTQVEQTHNNDDSVDVDLTVDINVLQPGMVSVCVELDGKEYVAQRVCQEGEQQICQRIHIVEPQYWYPVGYGEQHLYVLDVSLDKQRVRRTLGIRKAELITTKDDDGSTFKFRINGVDIFCRGANWIPADTLPSRITPKAVEKLLRAALAANMNMLRVWGGGQYEPDWFYELCDHLGILIWQDCMFSCSQYPSTEDFLQEVRSELNYNVRRLSNFASICLWCGDNEMIGSLTWFDESKKNRDRYLVNYDRLNRTIEQSVTEASPQNNWWPSSPSTGILDFDDAWHKDNSGDMHFWDVWHASKSFDAYRTVRPRFCSEFGFQSFPSVNLLKKYISGEHQNVSSPVMELHQKNEGGNERIVATLFRYFRFPKGFENLVYLSQVQQALAIKTAVDYWRSSKPRCMGTLYWQLNDCWPVASWSSLEYGGGWKLLHSVARRFYQPLNVVANESKDGEYIELVAINDNLQAQDVQVRAELLSLGDGARTMVLEAECSAPTDTSVVIGRIPLKTLSSADNTVLRFSWISGGEQGADHFSLVPYKNLSLLRPEIDISEERGEDGRWFINLQSAQVALFVSLESDAAGHFSDNCFDLVPGETKRVEFIKDEPQGEWPKEVVVRDLCSSAVVEHGLSYSVGS